MTALEEIFSMTSSPSPIYPDSAMSLNKNGWLQNEDIGIFHKKSPKSTAYKNRLILFLIWHYNAGPDVPDLKRFTQLMLNTKRRVSTHFFIDREGRLAQYVSTNRAAWHAGASKYPHPTTDKLLKGINRYSLGIEMENAGPLEQRQNGKFYSWWGKPIPNSQVVLAPHKSRPTGTPTPWQSYTQKQLTVAQRLGEALFTEIPSLTQNLGHDDISPRRKLDPGPAFPLSRMSACFESRA